MSEIAQQEKAIAQAVQNLGDTLHVYPVPAAQHLAFQWTVPTEAMSKIVISDRLGPVEMQLLPQAQLQMGKATQVFDISGLPAGQYVYRVHSSALSHTGKFLKE